MSQPAFPTERPDFGPLSWLDQPLDAPALSAGAAGRFIAGFEGWRGRDGLPTVVMYPEDTYGVGTLRMFLPGREVHKAGHANVFITNSFSIDTIDFADLCVFQRIQKQPQAEAIEYALSQGKGVVMDADDNFLRIWRSIRNYHAAANGGDLARIFERAAMKVDHLTVSTNYLAREYARLQRNITVCPNRCEYPSYVAPRRENPRLIIGFAGSGAADEEWAPAAKALGSIMRRRPDIVLVTAGRDYRRMFDKDVRDGIIMRGGLPYALFHALYRDFDIAIAPMTDIPFSRGKSCLKALDYAVYDLPMVGGDVLPYREYAQMGREAMGDDVVLLAKNAAQWEEHLERLIADPDLRAALGKRNGEFARRHFNALDAAETWWDVWKGVLERNPDYQARVSAGTVGLSGWKPAPRSETSRYLHLTRPYCQGHGVDLGSGIDPFPGAIAVDGGYGMEQGISPDLIADARHLPNIPDGALDYVYSSHLLEDFALSERLPVLREWTRLVRPGGYLVMLLPHREVFARRVAEGKNQPNLSHQSEPVEGEITEAMRAIRGWTVLHDALAEPDDPECYSILVVARNDREAA